MKKGLFFLAMLLITAFVSNAQTSLFHESFDTPSNADSVIASGALNNFAINTRLFYTGNQCDTTLVTPNDTAYLTTNSFSTVGLPFVFLSFSHICKIELLDGGEVQVSVNNGLTWTTLTGSEYVNPGNSQFVTSGNKFNANTYPLDWFPVQNTMKPTQTWWKNENFNISALVGNQPNVKIRFALRDGNGNGANFASGWFIDNIKITGAISELTPPTVHLKAPIYQDTVFSTGPYDIYAYIQDASGIDSTWIIYKVNNGPNNYVPMSWVSDSLYKGTVPSYTYTNNICYTVYGMDNSASHNLGSAGKCFYIKKPTVAVVVGTGTSTSANLPVNGGFNYGWGYMIYRVSELGFSGKIDSISFYVNNTVTAYQMLNQKIFIGHTGLTSFGTAQPDTLTAGWIRVFSGNVTFDGPGWSRVKLSVPFIYNGSQNLCVYWMNKDAATVTGFPLFRYTPTTTANCAYNANNTSSLVFPTSAGTTTVNKPNIRIAYYATPPLHDAGISLINSPSGTVVGSVPVPIKVNIKNFGSDSLNTVTVKWKLDGVTQPDSANWSGSLAEAVVSLPYTISSSTFTPGTHVIKAWTLKPDGFADPNHTNDTATMSFYSCNSILNGNYTIGPAGDYATVGAAIVSMQNCGISGPVVFNIASGTYTGAITIPAISGASATNTITFQSASGVNTDVVLQYAATAATDNWVVRLNGADYIQFKNLTIKSTSTSAFARVVELINGANYNKFENNIIQSIVSTSTTTAGVYSYTAASDNFNIFLNNKIQNAYYGVYFYGTTTLTKKGNQFIGNEITGWNYYGMYLYYNDSVRIEKNLLQNGPASTTNNHIYSSNNGFGCKILKNKIQSTGSGTFQGISLLSTVASSVTPNVIANNFISQSTVTSQGTGIYLSTTNFTNVYYNSVNITGTSTTGRGLYVTGGTTEVNIVNNILSNTGGGLSIYVATTAPINKCDYNDLFTTGTVLGYWSANRANLAAWQAASLKDSNSVSGNPQFISLNDLHTFATVILYKGKPLASITDDIDNQLRSLTLPSIGADETQKLAYDIALDSIISPVSSCQFTSAELVKVRIKNKGLNPMSNISVYYTVNSGSPVMGTYAGTIDTSTSIIYTFPATVNLSAPGNYLFDFYVFHPSDLSTLNDSINNRWVNGAVDLNVNAYTQSFEPNENYTDWAVVNTDNSSYKWIVPYVSSTYARTGSNSAEYFNNGANFGEDWLFSRCFSLQAGKTYSLSFWYRTNNTTPQTLTLKYGSAQNSAAMTTTLATLPGINTVAYQQSISQFVAPATGSYYFGWNGPVGVANYLYIDDINLKMVPEQEAALNKISAPSTGCLLTTTEEVMVRIKNTGADTINGNLMAYYRINNGTTVSGTVNGQIIPGDTLLYTFPTTANLAVTLHDSTFNIKAWISLVNDPIHTNDTLNKQVLSRHSPGSPTVIGTTVNYGQSATLQAISPDQVVWYMDATTPNTFHSGYNYTTPLLFDTTTYYVAATNDIPGVDRTVGTGTATSTYVPTYGWYNYSWSSSIYLSSELNFTGKIDTIAFYCTNTMAGFTMTDQRIYMRHYAGATLPDVNNPDITQFSQVFQGNITWTGPGWKKIALTIPFDYNGTSNIELAWENWDGSYTSGYPVFRGSTVPANMVKYRYLDANFPAGAGTYTTTRPNTRFISRAIPGCPSTRIPITANVIIPGKELSVDEIITPVTNCTFGTEIVSAKFINYGISEVNIPFTAGYYVSGNPVPVTETVNDTIPAGDSIIYTFTTPAVTTVPGGNIPFTFKVFVNVTGDPWQVNDTLSKTVTLSFSPPDPVCVGDTVPYGTSAVLTGTSTAPVNWFSSPTSSSILYTGSPFTTPNLFGNTTFYAEANTTIPGFTSQVGSGSASNSDVPVNGLYDYGWSSCLYLASDLNFLGRIDTLMFYVTNAISSFQMLDQRIYMRNTASTTLTDVNNPNVAAMTQVFQGNINFLGPGWCKIALTNPFYYNGASNLEMAWENRDGANNIGYPVFQVSTVPANMVKQKAQNSSFPTGAGTWLTTRPNTKFYHIGFGCPSHRIAVTANVTGLPAVDAGLHAFAAPVSPISLGAHDIKVILTNYGLDTLHSVQIKVKVNGVVQTPYNWVGSLPTNADTTLIIANYNFNYKPYPALNDLMAWTQNPNGITDPTTVNDTIQTVIDAHNPMNGVYFIRTANPDFNSFSEAVLPLNAWGVNGPVTIIADTGTYIENVSIPPINGASSINTITFQSITGVNSDVVIDHAATGSANNYVVQLNGADYIRFKNITMKSSSTANYGRVVEIKNASTNNLFEGNRIVALQITNNNSAAIYCNDINSAMSTFIGNDILNGYQGVYINGSSTNKIKGFKFLNNILSGYYYYGMSLNYADSVQAIGNSFTTNSASATNYSIYSNYCDNNSRFEKNNIIYNGTGSFYGIYLAYNNVTATLPNWVVNNFVSNTASSGTAYGIYLSNSNNVNTYYNSVNINASGGTTTRALYQTGGTNNLNVKNNNLANHAGGYAYYVNTPGSINVSDYNNFYTTGSVLAYWSADINTLAALQAASSKDVHSKSVVPGYLSTTDLHTYQFGIIGSASPVPGITTDIDNDPRNTVQPCIGADELSPLQIDAGITMINLPVNPAIAGIQPIKITLANFGISTINNVTIKYSVNGVLAGTFNWVGTLISYDTVQLVTVGNVNLTAGNSLICAWTVLPNNQIDNNTINDTSCTGVIVCAGPLSGTYTIGGTNPSFYSFNDAVVALTSCGISGPVIFNVAAGTYTEKINLGLITGVSATNTITFQSANGVNTSVVIQSAATGTADNYVVQLSGAKYIRFKNMTIKSTSTTTFARVVTVLNNSDYNIFQGNKIQSIIGTTSNLVPVYSTGGGIDYNKFINNEIKGGYYGIYWYSVSSALNKSNEFTNNTIIDWYTYGMYMYYNDSLIVNGNTTRNSTGTGTGYHIYSYYGDNGCRYEKNKIYGNNTGAFYGISLLYCDGTTVEPSIVANNMISEINGTSTAYGIYLSYTTYANLYYNSVNIAGGSNSAGRALFVTNGSNVSLQNNNLVSYGPGFAYYNATPSAIIQSDYNNLYTSSSVFAYWNGAISNLTGLQTASALEVHSVSNDPVFVSATDLHATAVGVDGKALPISGYTTDIDGDLRNATLPDIGADEFNALPYDVAVVDFIQPSGISSPAGTSITVIAQIRNFGSATVTSFPVSYKFNGGSPVTGTWTGTLTANQTVDYTFTVPIIIAAGTNSLCAYTAMSNDQNIHNDTLCINYTGVPVLWVPYADDFEGPNYFFASGTNSSWEFGIPTSTTINTAHSPVNVWKTNLDGFYNPSENSYLYTPYFNFGMVNSSMLDFWHYYNTETNNDGGRIKYSLNGTTWITLGTYPTDPAATNWYNSNPGGSPAWTGNSSGWVHSTYDLSTIPTIVNAVNPVQFRFEFFSNATNSNYDGWAIDDFALTAPPIAKDAGVTAILQPGGSTQTGSNVTVQVTIKNFGTDSLQAVPVRYQVNSQAVVSEVWHGNLNSGASIDYTFTTTFVTPGATYDLCSFTLKSGDIYWNNDTTCGSFNVTPATTDVGVKTILWPNASSVLTAGQQDSVKITIKNYGLSTETTFPVIYKINGIQVAAATWTGSLAPGDTAIYKFATLYTVPLGNYILCSKTQLSGDVNSANDETCKTYTTGIEDYMYSNWDLMQNIPNPANNSTAIGFVIPADGKVRLEIIDLLGNKVFVDEKEFYAGKHQIEIDVKSIPAGIYFYSAKYGNLIKTKRMVITK